MSQFSTYCNSQAIFSQAIFSAVEGKMGSGHCISLSIETPELPVLLKRYRKLQTLVPLEVKFIRMLRRGGGIIFPAPLFDLMTFCLPLQRKLGTALCPAPGQYFAAISGSHALSKSMLLRTLALLWLIGTNHVDTPPVSQRTHGNCSRHHNRHKSACGCLQKQLCRPHSANVIITDKFSPCQPCFLYIFSGKWVCYKI